jgi:uncharacterized protein (DUF58 family)
MNRVQAKGFREYFRLDPKASSSSLKVRYRHWFHPLNLYWGVMLYFLVLGKANPIFWTADLALAVYLLFLYLRTLRVARWITTERSIPAKVFQGQELEVKLKISNRSRFDLFDLVVKDHGTVAKDPLISFWIPGPLSRASVRTYTYKIKCDAPLGKQSLGPMQIVLTDALGIFEFRIIDDCEMPVEIVPDPSQRLRFDAPVALFGQPVSSEVSPRPGNSPSFFELRGYVPGDPLRKIAWKLSGKFQKFLVKEFEEAASNDFSIFLDMDSRNHFGNREMSTWNLLKEAALALLLGEAAGKRFQVLSERYHLPFGAGDSQMAVATQGILGLEPVKSPGRTVLAMAASGLLPYGSSLIYVTPTPSQSSTAFTAELQALRQQGVRVAVLLIDTGSFLESKEFSNIGVALDGPLDRVDGALDDLKNALEQNGVPCTVIETGDLVA